MSYTIPLVLAFSNDLGGLANRFGIDPLILPMVRVQRRDGTLSDQGIDLLRQMVLARAFPELDPQRRLALITEVFDTADTLDRLCFISGGHVRNLLILLYRCLQKSDPPIERDCVESVIVKRRDELSRTITPNEWELLRQVAQQKTVRGEDGYQNLLRSMFVFEYRDRANYWFDVNPILAEAKELQG